VHEIDHHDLSAELAQQNLLAIGHLHRQLRSFSGNLRGSKRCQRDRETNAE
jgi:hypothetical protein